MKTIQSTAIIAFILFSISSLAQSGGMDSRESLRFGFKSGVNFSNVYSTEPGNFVADGKIGYVGGASLSIPISKYLGVQPEILFSQKGFKGEGMLLGRQYNFTRTTSYLDFPLQFAVKPIEFVTILAGPQFSYLLKQKDVFTSSAISFTQEQEIKNDDVRDGVLGFVAGIDINVQHFTLGARSGWDIQNNRGDDRPDVPRYKNSWFQLALGYTF